VVNEIKSAGGQAIPNYDSVEHGESIVKTAIEKFGRLDILINNAGILRDVSFPKMTELDWDLIMRVHLKGAYSVTKAAWPHMREQKYGKVLFTSSNSGVYGSFGQANYAAAKMGLIGLSNTLAMEGAKYNILCNAIVPTAGSRLTRTVMPEELVDVLKPEYVCPLAVWLSHEQCQESGKVFEAGAGWYGTLQQYRSTGKAIPNASVEDVAGNWQEITSMKGAKNFKSSQEVTSELVDVVNANPQAKSKL